MAKNKWKGRYVLFSDPTSGEETYFKVTKVSVVRKKEEVRVHLWPKKHWFWIGYNTKYCKVLTRKEYQLHKMIHNL